MCVVDLSRRPAAEATVSGRFIESAHFGLEFVEDLDPSLSFYCLGHVVPVERPQLFSCRKQKLCKSALQCSRLSPRPQLSKLAARTQPSLDADPLDGYRVSLA